MNFAKARRDTNDRIIDQMRACGIVDPENQVLIIKILLANGEPCYRAWNKSNARKLEFAKLLRQMGFSWTGKGFWENENAFTNGYPEIFLFCDKTP